MDDPEQGAEEAADLPISRGLDAGALKQRMRRFARLRSAERVLPATATTQLGLSEERVAELRMRLTELGSNQTPAEHAIAEALVEIDVELDLMAAAVLVRCDGVDFSVLRSTVLRATTNHRREVLALLEVLLEDHPHVLARLSRIEYLITILSTEEVHDRRTIAHDPVSLTPLLAGFDTTDADPTLMDSIAMELYQAANTGDVGMSLQDLRQLRHRKAQLGLQTLNANMLRAVVTYNARMFNRFEDSVAAARASDADLESLLDADDFGPDGLEVDDTEWSEPGVLSEDDEIWDAIGRDPEMPSVFDSNPIGQVIAACRRRLKGVPIGSCSSERVALTLDMSLLEPLETVALDATDPDEEQTILCHTAVVGLMLRDLGAVRSDVLDLGIDLELLAGPWVQELAVAFTGLVSGKLADGSQYEAASILTGIKAKHLLAPITAWKTATGRRARRSHGDADEALSARELKKLAREAASGIKGRGFGGIQWRDGSLRGRLQAWSQAHQGLLVAVVLPLLLLVAVFGSNIVGLGTTTVQDIDGHSLSSISPLLESAYRSDEGRGPLLIGRVGNDFMHLNHRQQLEAARRMTGKLRSMGVKEAMVYDGRHRLQIHYLDGELRRPES